MEEQSALMLEKMLFTSSKPDENVHLCVVAIDDTHAASFRHGQHSRLQMNETVMLYNVLNPVIRYESTVAAVSESYDIIVFKLKKDKFKSFPRGVGRLFRGREYLQLGVDSYREPNWKHGIISHEKRGFYVGTSHGQVGDSGSGIFDSSGLFLGISVGKKCFSFCDWKNMPVGEIADHHPDTQIISSEVIFAFSGIIDDEFEPNMKSALVT
ncbi:unnamed protein product [Caenorhabditis bovis]|uniref:Uncharacterized protein n=1 Tax=Caenorhabditis bovis TaxID=2654633 RepID=A0A8S1EX44_9PELO|nr:unnamed protein product [Caenorhabditis bovis]